VRPPLPGRRDSRARRAVVGQLAGTRPSRLAALAVALAAVGCVSERLGTPAQGWTLSADQPVVAVPGGPVPPPQQAPTVPPPDAESLLELLRSTGAAALEPDPLAEQPPSPFHRLGRNVIRGLDNSWSKIYTLKRERTPGIVAMLASQVPDFPLEPNVVSPPDAPPGRQMRYVIHENFYQDETGKLGMRDALIDKKVADLLVITAPPETLLFIDQFLERVLADLPQIELQVRVVEINLDDLLDWDTKLGVSKLVNPDLPFDSATNPAAGQFGGGFPILDGNAATGYGASFGSFQPTGSISGFLLSLQGVHDNWRVDSLLSLLQSIGASELISSPTVTVLNGHRAIINTGSKVPVFSATGLGNNAQISTKFEDTGVRVEIIPFIVGEDVIRIDLSVDVSAVTGEVPFNLGGTEVSTPVISTRDTGTTVHVHSGQVFAVGGLRSRESIETISKVPFLGDIPLLGWLFKSRSSRQRNTEILFFITPRIRIPSETLVAPLP